mmetsp:Transcript_52771/g.103184  ORF Transcript_52771/g.103184 Transcript_52771/m.103184 type:complete len:261 (-) Transcript_52771:167-949(-)
METAPFRQECFPEEGKDEDRKDGNTEETHPPAKAEEADSPLWVLIEARERNLCLQFFCSLHPFFPPLLFSVFCSLVSLSLSFKPLSVLRHREFARADSVCLFSSFHVYAFFSPSLRDVQVTREKYSAPLCHTRLSACGKSEERACEEEEERQKQAPFHSPPLAQSPRLIPCTLQPDRFRRDPSPLTLTSIRRSSSWRTWWREQQGRSRGSRRPHTRGSSQGRRTGRQRRRRSRWGKHRSGEGRWGRRIGWEPAQQGWVRA